MTSAAVAHRASDQPLIVTRARRPATAAAAVLIAGVVVLALLPYLVNQGFTDTLINLFILVTIASMWNVLAGYAGMVSVGQQAFIGVGAYTVLIASQHGVEAFVAIPIALVVAALLAVPASWLVFRLAGAYFAIGTWVLATVAQLAVERFPSLGGGTGAPVPGLENLDPTLLHAYTYWATLALAVAAVLSVFILLRSRFGLVLTAARDNEIGARSSGARVGVAKQVVYLLAAAGCAGAGAMIAISQLNVEPGNVFSVQWTAYMIFAGLIGGYGTIEGPVIGAIVFIVLQQTLAQYNAWYLIILGAVAVVMAVWARRGLWGLFTARVPLHLFPVGYYVHLDPGVTERHGVLRWLLGPARIPRAAVKSPAAPLDRGGADSGPGLKGS